MLHAVRLIAYADTARIAHCSDASPNAALQHLGDAWRRGWVQPSSFAGDEGCSLTESDKAHREDLMATLTDTIAALETAATALAEIERLLTSRLTRFSGYHDTFRAAWVRRAPHRPGSSVPTATPAIACGSSFTKT